MLIQLLTVFDVFHRDQVLANLVKVNLSSFTALYRVSSLSAKLRAEHSRTREVSAAYFIEHSTIVCERYLETATSNPENARMQCAFQSLLFFSGCSISDSSS